MCTWQPGCSHGNLWLKWHKGKGHCLEGRSRNCEEIMVGHPHAAEVPFRTRTGSEVGRGRLRCKDLTGRRRITWEDGSTATPVLSQDPGHPSFSQFLLAHIYPPTPSYFAFQRRKAGKKQRKMPYYFPTAPHIHVLGDCSVQPTVESTRRFKAPSGPDSL